MTREETFLRFLRSAIWGKPEQLTGREMTLNQYQSLMKLAQQQAVAALLAQALIDSGLRLPRQAAAEVYALTEATRQRNKEMDEAVVALCREMEERNIRIVVFKGQTLAPLYPDPGLRQSGDIDFACHPDDWDKAEQYFREELKLEIEDNVTKKHLSFERNGIEYELHRSMTEFCRPKNQHYWDRVVMPEIWETIDFIEINGTRVPTLSAEINAIYVFVHIFHHLMSEGIGLRQFCDFALCAKESPLLTSPRGGKASLPNPLPHRKREKLEEEASLPNPTSVASSTTLTPDLRCPHRKRELLEKHLKGLGLLKAYTGLGAILTDYLGLPEKEFPIPISQDDHRRAPKLLEDIWKKGNFGKNEKYSQARGVIHGIEHLGRIFQQAWKFGHYAPAEAWWRVPYMFQWWGKKILRVCTARGKRCAALARRRQETLA